MPIGHIWKFDIELNVKRYFLVRKSNFSNIRIETIMLKFLATTAYTRKRHTENSSDRCEKLARKHETKNAHRNLTRT